MSSHHVRGQLILIVTCLSMCRCFASDAYRSGVVCRDFYENKLKSDIQNCLKDTDKLSCLQAVLKQNTPEKVILCENEVWDGSDLNNILFLVQKYKTKLVHQAFEKVNKFIKDGFQVDIGSDLVINVVPGDNETIDFIFKLNNNQTEVKERKMMKMNKSNILAMLFTPAMFIAGMMPWILPGIKMAVMMVTMMNNMAFSSALFALIRGYIFDTRPDDHIIYVNNGYKNQHNHPHKIYIHGIHR